MSSKMQAVSSMVIFGSTGLLIKNINMPSEIIALSRGFIGAVFLVLVCFLSKNNISIKSIKKNFLLLICTGIALGTNWIFMFEAYRRTTVAIATVSYYFAPVIITIMSSVILKEKLSPFKMLCILMSVIGMIFVSGIVLPLKVDSNLIGILFGLAAAVSYSCMTIINKLTKNLNSMDSTISQLGISAIVLLIYSLIKGSIYTCSYKLDEIMLIAILGILHTGFAFHCFFASVQKLETQTFAILSYIDPVTAILLSSVFLNEKMSWLQIFGTFLIIFFAFLSENKEIFHRKTHIPHRA